MYQIILISKISGTIMISSEHALAWNIHEIVRDNVPQGTVLRWLTSVIVLVMHLTFSF